MWSDNYNIWLRKLLNGRLNHSCSSGWRCLCVTLGKGGHSISRVQDWCLLFYFNHLVVQFNVPLSQEPTRRYLKLVMIIFPFFLRRTRPLLNQLQPWYILFFPLICFKNVLVLSVSVGESAIITDCKYAYAGTFLVVVSVWAIQLYHDSMLHTLCWLVRVSIKIHNCHLLLCRGQSFFDCKERLFVITLRWHGCLALTALKDRLWLVVVRSNLFPESLDLFKSWVRSASGICKWRLFLQARRTLVTWYYE